MAKSEPIVCPRGQCRSSRVHYRKDGTKYREEIWVCDTCEHEFTYTMKVGRKPDVKDTEQYNGLIIQRPRMLASQAKHARFKSGQGYNI